MIDVKRAEKLAQAEQDLDKFLGQLRVDYMLDFSELLGTMELVKWDLINDNTKLADEALITRKLR